MNSLDRAPTERQEDARRASREVRPGRAGWGPRGRPRLLERRTPAATPRCEPRFPCCSLSGHAAPDRRDGPDHRSRRQPGRAARTSPAPGAARTRSTDSATEFGAAYCLSRRRRRVDAARRLVRLRSGTRTCDNGGVDRSHYPTRKLTLEDEGRQDDVRRLTPEQRVAMVWQLTAQAWTFKDGRWDEPRLRRDVVRTVRRPR